MPVVPPKGQKHCRADNEEEWNVSGPPRYNRAVLDVLSPRELSRLITQNRFL